MSKTAAVIRAMRKLKANYVKRNYARVLSDATEIVRRNPGCVPALIAYSRAAQLVQEREIRGNVKKVYTESKRVLQHAVAIDSASVEALNELAYYVRTYEDSKRASKHFDGAIKLSMAQLKEAYIGKLRCLTDNGQIAARRKLFAAAIAIFGNDRDLKTAIE